MHLLDLIEPQDLEDLSESFEAAVGLPILFTDSDGRPLAQDVDPRRFCVSFLTETEGEERNTCLMCGRRTERETAVLAAIEQAASAGRPIIDTCPGMFLDSAVPIHIGRRIIGYAVCARALDAEPDLGVYRDLAIERGLDPDACIEVAKAATVMPRTRVEAAARHLDAVVNLVVRVAAENYRTQREVELAAEIQDGLIPRERFIEGFDHAIHFTPSSATGGDLMDAFRLGGGDAVFYAGDVSGHGVPAALVMSLLSGVIGSTRHANVWPADMLQRLNAAFRRHFAGRRTYATMFYARYVASDQSLVYANAGHERPYLIRSRSGDIITLDQGAGFPLGFFGDAEYTHGSVEMETGDTLALYTDGLVERKTPQGEWLSHELLPSVLSAACHGNVEESLDRVLDAINARVDQDGGIADDQGLLLVRREPTVERSLPSDLAMVSDVCKDICRELRAEGLAEDDLDAIRLALDEAITNAIRHGNDNDSKKTVRVQYSLGVRSAKFVVTDQGGGNWHSGSKPIAAPHLDGAGYGLTLISRCMDHVEWNVGGSPIFMARRLQARD